MPVVLLLCAVSAGNAQPASCTYRLGFATLHALIPDAVGGCLDDEFHDPVSGSGLQHTANDGLLVWHRSDNVTAFTHGSVSWVNAPVGTAATLQ